MKDTYSLVSILKDDPDLGKRFVKKIEEAREDKATLLRNAGHFNKQYEKEIAEGTKLRQKLISECKSKGLEENEINWGGKFLPAVQTPILNFLYFLLRDCSDDVEKHVEKLRILQEEKLKTCNIGDLPDDNMDYDAMYMLLKSTAGSRELLEEAEDAYNKRYGHLEDDFESDDSDNLEQTPDMEEYLYGNMTHDVFVKIKKLKALSKSSNEQEAFLAYRKCLDLCREYSLEFDKIPCNIK